ncbi:MAG: efflux RND transporter periplasmic adaptor subunit [Bacteroidetes bacterium]|nr:efflux RND transporter periplasmic adaptor subunit [Bacteroidota bacterium]
MKSLLNVKTTSALILIAVLASCSGAKQGDKRAELDALNKQHNDLALKIEEFEKEQKAISEKIDVLEKELAKEDPKFIKSIAKDIQVTPLAVRSFDYYVQTQGTILAIDNIQMSAKSAGVVTHVFAHEGESISQGQILAQIDNSLIVRNIDELKANLELATTVFDRQKNLWAQKIGTEIQYLQAKSNKESLERRLATLNEQNEMTKIKSPINGTVETVNIKVGENVAPGVPAFRVINTNDLKASAKVSEAYITSIEKGNKVTVSFPDLNKSIDAKVTFVGRNIDGLTRSFPLEVKLPSAQFLRPNMTAVLRVVFHTEAQALCVPVNVVQDVNGSKIVYIAEKDGDKVVARKKVVEVAGVYDNLAQIKSGLKVGDQIITIGYQGLNDGELIKL